METLASLIAGLVSGETVQAVRRARVMAIVYGVAGVLALTGLGFVIGAAYIWTAARYGPFAASLGFGIGFLVVAGLVVLVHKLAAGSRARRRAQRRKADLTALGVTAALAALPALARSKGGIGALLGPAAALVAFAIYKENARSRTRRGAVRPRPDDNPPDPL